MKKKIIITILYISAILLSLFSNDSNINIIIDFRLPKLLFILFAGGGLAICGALLQRVFNNPLATSYTTGVVSAGAMFSAIYIFASSFIIFPKYGIFLSSIIGTTLTLFILKYVFTKTESSNSVILTGVSLNFFYSSIILLLQSISSLSTANSILTYITGSLSVYSYFYTSITITISIIFFIIIYKKSTTINALSLGDIFAKSKGIDYNKNFINLLLISSIFIAIITSFAGPIAFIDLIVPHIVNRVYKTTFKNKLIINFLLGALILLICDIISRTAIDSYIIPISAITGIIGSIFFLIATIQRFKSR